MEREVSELWVAVMGFPGFSRAQVQSPHPKAHQDGRVDDCPERGMGKGNQGRVGVLERARKGSRNAGKMGIPTPTSPAGSPEHTWAGLGRFGGTIPTLGAEVSFLKPGI